MVALVDILGFSEIVEQARTNDQLFEFVRNILSTIEVQARRLEDYRRLCNPLPSRRVSSLSRTDIRMTAFSDCYLISDECSDEVTGEKVMTAVQTLGSHLLAQGILTRGAVVRGEAYHDDRIAFGPAIIAAHKIEQHVAKYPRIIVADEVYEALEWENKIFWNGRMVRRDVDGCLFINVLAPPLSAMEPIANQTIGSETAEFLGVIRAQLENKLNRETGSPERLKKPTDPECLKKLTNLKWMAYHFNLEAGKHRLPLIEVSADTPHQHS